MHRPCFPGEQYSLLDIGSELLRAVVEAVVHGHEGEHDQGGEHAGDERLRHRTDPVARTCFWLPYLAGAENVFRLSFTFTRSWQTNLPSPECLLR